MYIRRMNNDTKIQVYVWLPDEFYPGRYILVFMLYGNLQELYRVW